MVTTVAVGSSKDVDIAVEAAKKVSRLYLFQARIYRHEGHFQAFKTTWGLHCPGSARGKLLAKLADLMEAHTEELAALEALDVGASIRIE